jgi:hypothetical protein
MGLKRNHSKLNNKVLFIGNGINNLTNENETSWKNLLIALAEKVGSDDESVFLIQQFPLLFETLYLIGKKNNRIKSEIELKRIVAERVDGIILNDIHKRIAELNPQHIITSNYDFALEKGGDFHINTVLEEKRYSLFRRYFDDNTERSIWHIHGDYENPNTINLGFEHYSGQLQYLRNYVVSGTHYNKMEIPKDPLVKRLEEIKRKTTSWVDLFFREEIHIIGLRMDFIEIDLWWLLTYRARYISKGKGKINNRIIYYIPKKFVDESKGKIIMLESIGINVEIIDGEDFNFYNQVMNSIEGASRFS